MRVSGRAVAERAACREAFRRFCTIARNLCANDGIKVSKRVLYIMILLELSSYNNRLHTKLPRTLSARGNFIFIDGADVR